MKPSVSSRSTSASGPIDPKRDQLLRLLEGRQDIDGRFTDIRRLGSSGGLGAFSLLFTALDAQSNKRVAIKVFHPDVRDSYRRYCFEREESILSGLTGQPDIITLVAPRSQFVESLTAQGGFQYDLRFDYFALELATSDVSNAVYSRSMTASQLLGAFHQMCRGVQRLHGHDVAHRDIKPSNFLVMSDGSARLCDMGTARSFSDGHSPVLQTYPGPPGDTTYCAPEMLACLHDVDARIAFGGDLYALGASLFEMFSGAVLNLQLMDASFMQGLSLTSQVPRPDRVRIYHQLLPQIAGRDMPSISDYGWPTPPAIVFHIDALYRGMAHLDYRRRLTDFNSIFRQIQICRLILANEERVLARRSFRLRVREARKRRLLRATE